MLIAIDIGNTRIKAGKFYDNKLIEFVSFNDVSLITSYLKPHTMDSVAIASVVPSRTKVITENVKKITKKSPFIITKDIKLNLKISYKTPETLGVDRICSAEGAFYLFKNSKKFKSYKKGTYILSIDFGTATTINVIEYPRKFIGGLIAPGVDMMFDSLNHNTAQLHHLEVSSFKSTIGNDTNSSIASGVVTSIIGMIEKTIDHLKKEKSAKDVFVYITGGNAKKIIPFLNFDFVYEEGLVLYGINALWELNKYL
jgi:type III pantothenate kinase